MPEGISIMSTWSLMLVHLWFCSAATWISLSKWPMLPTIAMSFIARMWSMRMTSLLPVVVMKMSARGDLVFQQRRPRSRPSPPAARRSGRPRSPSPARRRRAATRPSPCPRRRSRRRRRPCRPSSCRCARRMPSTSDSLQPYLLSNFDLVTLSLTLIAGKGSRPFFMQLVEPVDAGGGFLGHALDRVRAASRTSRGWRSSAS